MTTDLHVETSGEGPAVVLVHSSGLSGRQWKRLVPVLVERKLRVVVPDLTGHGASAPWPEPQPFSFRTDVERIAAILRAEGGAHLLGHSYGALVAIHAALAAPDAVRTLTLYDPVTFGVFDARDDDARATLRVVAPYWGTTAEEHEGWLRRFVDYWGGAGAWMALREDARAEFRRVGWVVREGVKTLMEDTTPASTFAAALTMPVHLVTGEHTPVAARRIIQRLGEAIPGATTNVVPGVGHMGPLMAPDVVNRLFVEGIARAQ
ncbi:MAG TPA: alpha/beta hydrolase [Polyangiaceae bacterium]|jgi:pimeloyl-ACP methyl ester carboxylesterase